MTPTTENTAAQLLAAQAQIHEQMAERRRALAAMIAESNAELAMLDGKPAPRVKARPGPKVGSKRAPKESGKFGAGYERVRDGVSQPPVGTAPQMPLPAMEPNAAQNGGE